MSNEVQEIFLKDYKKPSFTIESVNLTFELFEEETNVTNIMKFEKLDESADLVLDAQELELKEVVLDGEVLGSDRYTHDEETLTISNVPQEFTLEIRNRIYPQKNTELEGLYKSGDIFCTQCEPEGFRRITPYLDRPDVMSIFTTTVIADQKKYPILLANGNKVHCHESFNTRHGVTWHDPHPKPSYLFALVAGDLDFITDSFVTASGNDVELNIYVDKGNSDKADHAMKSLINAMKWDEEKYGREYDLDIYNIVAVDSFNMGAMENKGLNIFNSAYVLADADTATDANFMGIESVIAHEYFHNWTGNRITCRNWFQLTLKEGLTVFRDQCFSADMNSSEVQRIQDVKALRERQFVEDASPTAHPIQPKSYISMNNFYTATVYEKGAEVIRMLHTLLGEENYRKATDLYFETFDGQAVRTDDFLWAMKEYGEFDLEHFKLWYDQSGTPSLEVEENYADGKYTLTLTQNVPNKVDGSLQKAMYFPLKIALMDKTGAVAEEKMLIISKESESFMFEGFEEKPVLSINRDFSAPVIIKHQDVDFAFLMQHDTNSFTKYEAAQEFAISILFKLMEDIESDISEYLEAFGALLELDTDLSYKALLLELPSISTLMQKQDVVDFEPLYKAKDKLSYEVAKKYEAKLLKLYFQNHEPLNSALDSKSIAKRALKNRVLSLLSALESKEIAAVAKEQYEHSLTMTDRITALDVLESIDAELSEIAFNDFYNRYKNNTLVMNKYFALLAASPREGVLDRVMALQNDEVYDEKVPNLVRSLIGVFARNYKYFHAKDGYGYKFLSDKIIEIDKINPQMASALSGAFKIYPKMIESNKKLMKATLECIVSTQGISKNTFEIVSKILK
ncbi:aminopeptidase N [Sulfurimonas marina]|uniref:Aminopeptidase N n=1 Tax=Sulfurimonas marina TaxID=2590551 RepID=A0A7M1AWU6_9BACT|nr:aminopeptidase N [Sulfurimonas marina]QOP40842.1 aminopeptidase N [Sulfurimonas marina]